MDPMEPLGSELIRTVIFRDCLCYVKRVFLKAGRTFCVKNPCISHVPVL